MPWVRSKSPSSGTITHGSQLTSADVGPYAYDHPVLGRKVQAADLTRSTGTHWISDYITGSTPGSGVQGDPYIVELIDVDTLLWDMSWVTLRASRVRQTASGFLNGTHHVGADLEYVTIDPATVGDECMHYESWSALRCSFSGCSDGGKINGGSVTQEIVECIISTAMASAEDHNDGLQNVGGSGTVNVRRCKIDAYPTVVVGGGSGGPNACIMSADMTAGSTFHLNVEDCELLNGWAGYCLRLYDGGLTTNITYRAVGNSLDISDGGGYVDRGTTNTTPVNQIEWSGNYDAQTLQAVALT